MKKSILGSTALVAVGALASAPAQAEGWEASIGGYMNTYFSVGAIDESPTATEDYNATGLFSDGEVHFNFSLTADNGMQFGATVELEAFGLANSFGDTIDEKFIWIEGSFGRIEAGSTNSAAYQMHYAAPYAGLPINSGWVTVFVPVNFADFTTAFEHPGLSTYIDFGGDDNVISYYTPRISGFQLGVTYVPSVVMNGDGKNFPVEADKETEYHNGFAVGVNFVEDFNGFGVAIAGGWRYAQLPDSLSGVPGADNYGAYSVGAQLSYAGFTVGGSYANEYSGITDGTISTEGEGWDAGVSYAIGPWTIAATYFSGEISGEHADVSTDAMRAAQVGLNYALGPGISVGAGVMWGEYESENGADQSGIVGAAGLTFSF
jgi:outer membrane protein OmpU